MLLFTSGFVTSGTGFSKSEDNIAAFFNFESLLEKTEFFQQWQKNKNKKIEREREREEVERAMRE